MMFNYPLNCIRNSCTILYMIWQYFSFFVRSLICSTKIRMNKKERTKKKRVNFRFWNDFSLCYYTPKGSVSDELRKISNIKTAKFHNQHSKIYTFLKCSMSRWGLRTCTTAFYYPNICKLKFSVFFICFCLHDIQNTYKHTLWTNEKKLRIST